MIRPWLQLLVTLDNVFHPLSLSFPTWKRGSYHFVCHRVQETAIFTHVWEDLHCGPGHRLLVSLNSFSPNPCHGSCFPFHPASVGHSPHLGKGMATEDMRTQPTFPPRWVQDTPLPRIASPQPQPQRPFPSITHGASRLSVFSSHGRGSSGRGFPPIFSRPRDLIYTARYNQLWVILLSLQSGALPFPAVNP